MDVDESNVDILLVSGLHANEVGAPVVVAAVARLLLGRGVRTASFSIPRAMTLLGLLDDPATADPRYSMPEAGSQLDMDLDGLDADLQAQYPTALVFEFHNAPATHWFLNIDPAKPTEDYEIGTVAPDFVRPYEIGTWRNVDLQGQPGKFLIELPACYRPTDPARLARRLLRLRELQATGYDLAPNLMTYLEQEVDPEASRERGYLDAVIARKVAAWIMRTQADQLSPRIPAQSRS